MGHFFKQYFTAEFVIDVVVLAQDFI